MQAIGSFSEPHEIHSAFTPGIKQYRDYCDHCLGWIGPLIRDAGFVINHEHNPQGQCWWEMRRADDSTTPIPPSALHGPCVSYVRTNDPDDKTVVNVGTE